MNRPRSGTQDQISEGLKVCSTWCTDGHGSAKKNCMCCPYQNPADPAAMNCGERLMHDAGLLIEEQKATIEMLRSQVQTMSRELARNSQREYNE